MLSTAALILMSRNRRQSKCPATEKQLTTNTYGTARRASYSGIIKVKQICMYSMRKKVMDKRIA